MVIAAAYRKRKVYAVASRAHFVLVFADHRATVVDADFVGQQDAPAGRSGAGLPVGFFAEKEEFLVEAAHGVPRRPIDCQARTADIAADGLRFGGLARVERREWCPAP